MNERLKSYLEKCSPATVDKSTLDDLRSAMEQAVPKIVESIRLREQLAAQFRITAPRPTQSSKDKQG
jgi:hypothetical protein